MAVARWREACANWCLIPGVPRHQRCEPVRLLYHCTHTLHTHPVGTSIMRSKQTRFWVNCFRYWIFGNNAVHASSMLLAECPSINTIGTRPTSATRDAMYVFHLSPASPLVVSIPSWHDVFWCVCVCFVYAPICGGVEQVGILVSSDEQGWLRDGDVTVA